MIFALLTPVAARGFHVWLAGWLAIRRANGMSEPSAAASSCAASWAAR